MERKISALSDGAPVQLTDEAVIARAGQNYKLDIADLLYNPGLADFPEIQKETFTITSAQILNLFSSPVTLLPAIAGTVRVPEYCHGYRQLGTAYTVGGSDVGIDGNSRNQPYFMALKGLLTDTGPGLYIGMRCGNSASGSFTSISALAITSTSPLVNDPIRLTTASSDPTGGTGNLIITLYWRDWTVAPL